MSRRVRPARFAAASVAVLALALLVGPTAPAFAQDGDPDGDPDARDAWLDGDEGEVADPAADPSVPEAPGADLGPAKALVREGKLGEAASALDTLLDEYPQDASLLLLLGEVEIASKSFDAAIGHLRRAAEIAPRRDRIHFQLGTALASTGAVDDALAAFGEELTRSEDPQILVLARLNRSLLLQRGSRWAEAAEELEGVLQFEPDRAEVYGDLASLYLQAGNPVQAGRTLERGADVGFRSAVHWYSVGARWFADDRLDDAVAAFREAVAIDPDRADARRSLGAALDRLGRPAEAAEHFRRYLELRPDAADADRIRRQLDAYAARHP